ncbi:MAG: hypothetical protein II995_01700 [Oscillospiraceae bacterium]|nr:hypothetical protein [Oscillospiraceae bacterium]
MKKILTAAVIAALAISLTACGCSASTDMNATSDPLEPSSDTASSGAGGYTDTETLVGIGIVANTSDSTEASESSDGSASFDLTACAVCVDSDGRIIDVRFDAIETGIGFDYAGAFTGDIESDIYTKRELGDDYGLGAVSGIGMNWHEQMDSFEDWLRGKTVTEAMDMKLSYDGDRQIPDEDNLRSSVTISVSDQLKALEKAYADATGSSMTGSGMTGSNSSAVTDDDTSYDDTTSEESSVIS